MKINIPSTLGIILLLSSAPISGVSANPNINFTTLDFTKSISFDSKPNWQHQFTVKKDIPYDESKGSSLRRGTENWDEPQGSFFIIPAVFIGLAALFLFFNRD